MPGGGTTDYAVDAFHSAMEGRPLTCYLGGSIRTVADDDHERRSERHLELMDAPAEDIHVRTSYNLHGCDFTPAELTDAIAAHIPGFEVTFDPDHRQSIAASWPDRLDDRAATRDWGWKAEHDVNGLVARP